MIFWDAVPCSLIDRYQSFGGTNSLHLQGRRVWRWRQHTSSIHWYLCIYQLDSVTSQKFVILRFTVVRTSDIRMLSFLNGTAYLNSIHKFGFCSVDITTGYGIESQGLIPFRSKRLFSSPQHPDQLWRPWSLLLKWYQRVKWPEHEADHSPPFRDKVMNGGATAPPLPHMSSWSHA
jgi:hypothetical protein